MYIVGIYIQKAEKAITVSVYVCKDLYLRTTSDLAFFYNQLRRGVNSERKQVHSSASKREKETARGKKELRAQSPARNVTYAQLNG